MEVKPVAVAAGVAAGAAGLAALAYLTQRDPSTQTEPPSIACSGLTAIACGKGGYSALRACPLDAPAPTADQSGGSGGGRRQARRVDAGEVEGATRGAAACFEGVGEDQVVTVRVTAAGINYADVCIRWGLYTSWNTFGGGIRPGLRAGAKGDVPGFEFAGVVQKVGSAVTRVKVGDQVFGATLFGAYSSRIDVPEHLLFQKPPTLSYSEAAGLPAVAMTAWFAVTQQASPIPAGGRVLVHSAAGGVGSMLVQMCKAKGWRVVSVVGQKHKEEYCRGLGSDAVVVKEGKTPREVWAEIEHAAPGGFAAVFDANGAATLMDSYNHLAPCGKLICYGFHSMLPRAGGVLGLFEWARIVWQFLLTPRFNPLTMVPANKSLLTFNLSFLFARRDLLDEAMADILRWIEAGAVRPPHVTAYPMAQVRTAHAAIESGSTIGKLVIIPP